MTKLLRLSDFEEREPGWWYKPDDTVVVHPSGHYKPSQIEVRVDLMCASLEWCGCGDPVQALTYLRDVLRTLPSSGAQPDDFEPLHRARAELFSNNPAEYFTYFWLDNMSLTEHGGSVPGWRTKAGDDLLEDLETALAEDR